MTTRNEADKGTDNNNVPTTEQRKWYIMGPTNGGMKGLQMGGAGSVKRGERSKDIWWTGGEWRLNNRVTRSHDDSFSDFIAAK